MILGIDLGTSGLKCVITNLNEKIVCSTSTKLNINQFDGNCNQFDGSCNQFN